MRHPLFFFLVLFPSLVAVGFAAFIVWQFLGFLQTAAGVIFL